MKKKAKEFVMYYFYIGSYLLCLYSMPTPCTVSNVRQNKSVARPWHWFLAQIRQNLQWTGRNICLCSLLFVFFPRYAPNIHFQRCRTAFSSVLPDQM